nr:hypothetical protein [uncultured Rhodopila sp.]
MSSVTITGTNSNSVVLNYDGATNYALAQTLAAQINAEIAAGNVVGDPVAPSPVPGAGKTGILFQSTESVILPSNYTVDAITGLPNANVIANSLTNQVILSDEATALNFYAAAGAGTVVAGGGGSQLQIGGTGNWLLSSGAYGGPNVITDFGSGTNTISAGPGGNHIVLGSGHDLVLSTGEDLITAGHGDQTVLASAGSRDNIHGVDGKLLFVGGAANVTIVGGGSGSVTFTGTSGSQDVQGSLGGDNHLTAGLGQATLIGAADGDVLTAGNTGQLLIAGAGNETLNAVGADTLYAGSGHDQINDGFGSDTFIGGSGHASISATANGSDVFDFIASLNAAGHTEVTGFTNASVADIHLHLQGLTVASQTNTAHALTVNLSDGTVVKFDNVTTHLVAGSNYNLPG